jgi:hypothetical protein
MLPSHELELTRWLVGREIAFINLSRTRRLPVSQSMSQRNCFSRRTTGIRWGWSKTRATHYHPHLHPLVRPDDDERPTVVPGQKKTGVMENIWMSSTTPV